MDKAALVGPDIEASRQFLEQLESAGVPLTAALWQWNGFLASDTWELDLATPLVDEIGIKETYRRIRDILSRGETPSIDLMDINLFTPDAWFIKSLRREFQGKHDIPIEIKQPVGDHEIERGYIYFVK